MFQRIVVLSGSESAAHTVPIVAGVEVSEKDIAEAANYLAALKTAYEYGKMKSQAYSTDSVEEAARYCQENFF